MDYNHEVTDSLEQLLETLIKMVGKTNQNVDNLQRRVAQLECYLKEQPGFHKEFLLQTTAKK